MDTLKGGGIIPELALEDGTVEKDFFVRQLPVREYDKAFLKLDDEIELAAIIAGKTKEWIGSLSPESYELLQSKIQEVNAKGFFSFATRKQDNLMKRVASVSPEMLKVVMAQVANPSNSSAPASRSRPV